MSFLLSWLEPTFNALNPFNSLPFTYRWRLLLFQPILLFVNTVKYLSCLSNHRHTVHHIPTRTGTTIRTLIFHPPTPPTPTIALRPLHLTLHAGGFMGGIPEYNAVFASHLSAATNAVTVAPTYRFAPLHPYPAAPNDVADILAWLSQHAAPLLHADPALLTVSGFSAGANLALSVAQGRADAKASVTFYAPVDLRAPARSKPRPAGLPGVDPLAAVLPLADAYAGTGEAARRANERDPRLHPCLARLEDLPERMLFVVLTVDILLHEQLAFVERLKREVEKMGEEGRERVVESLIVEGQVHGWVELPDFAINKKTKHDAFRAAVEFIRDTHRKHGYEWIG